MRFVLGVEYAGGGFSGWQAQRNSITVQSTLERALTRIADHPIKVICAGRTDAGVHATGQVVHFDTDAVRPLQAWVAGTNTLLPKTIAIRWAKAVDVGFHARFSALSRSYQYVICNTPMHCAINAGRATWYRHLLNIEWMQEGGNNLLGEQDFSSFRGTGCESKTPVRCLQSLAIKRQGEFVIIELSANAFLYHMVRNIAGVLMRVGAGFESPQWVREVLSARDRTQAGETASASGLYLVQVTYPPPWLFPSGRNILLV